MTFNDSIALTYLFVFFLLIFIVMIILEVILTYTDIERPNFFYDYRLEKKLYPKLKSMNNISEICDLLIQENTHNKTILTWRPAIFTSFITAITATFFLKLYDRQLEFKIFFLNFVIIFIMLIGFSMIINYHCYGLQFQFFNVCLEKIKKTQPTNY